MIALLMLAEVAVLPMPAFLSGCWEQHTASGQWTEECWTDTRGGVMIGSGRMGRDDTVGHWEWMRIEQGADGGLIFYASPKGAAPVGFRAVEANAESVTFVNEGHDFPQRIRYSITETGLEAEVSLADGSSAQRWTYQRTAGAVPQ